MCILFGTTNHLVDLWDRSYWTWGILATLVVMNQILGVTEKYWIGVRERTYLINCLVTFSFYRSGARLTKGAVKLYRSLSLDCTPRHILRMTVTFTCPPLSNLSNCRTSPLPYLRIHLPYIAPTSKIISQVSTSILYFMLASMQRSDYLLSLSMYFRQVSSI